MIAVSAGINNSVYSSLNHVPLLSISNIKKINWYEAFSGQSSIQVGSGQITLENAWVNMIQPEDECKDIHRPWYPFWMEGTSWRDGEGFHLVLTLTLVTLAEITIDWILQQWMLTLPEGHQQEAHTHQDRSVQETLTWQACQWQPPQPSRVELWCVAHVV